MTGTQIVQPQSCVLLLSCISPGELDMMLCISSGSCTLGLGICSGGSAFSELGFCCYPV